MSIAGYVGADFAGQEREVQRALRKLAYRLGTASSVIVRNGAVLGATNDSSIWMHAETGTVVAWSGTIYEQKKTAAEFGCAADASAAEIAARGYVRWGLDALNKIWGEYALLIWDERTRRMLHIRDPLTRRPLFYAPVGSGFANASEVRALLGWKGVDDRVSEEMLVRALTIDPKPDMTLWRGIFTTTGGGGIAQQGGKPPVRMEYWDPLQIPQLHLNDWRDYATAIREAMREAVRVRLPREGVVASQMSSGFDSSGVTALVAEELAKQNRQVIAYTSVPVKPTHQGEILGDRFGDEWPLAAKVAAMYPNIEHVPIPTNYGTLFGALDNMVEFGRGTSGFIRNARWYWGIVNEAHKRGAVSMFEGQAGNLTASYNGGFGLYDLRRRGQWLKLVQAVRDRHRNDGTKLITMVRWAWMPSRKANDFLMRIRGKKAARVAEISLLREDFYRNSGVKMQELSAMGNTIDGDRTNGRTWRADILRKPDMSMMYAAQMRGFGLNREDPMADRKLVELVLSIPDEDFAPGGRKRELYREAFRNHLPAELLNEKFRGLQLGDFLHHFEQDLPEVFAELEKLEATPQVAAVLDLPRMRGMLERFHDEVKKNRTAADQLYNYTVGGALSLGRFLRRMDELKEQTEKAADWETIPVAFDARSV